MTARWSFHRRMSGAALVRGSLIAGLLAAGLGSPSQSQEADESGWPPLAPAFKSAGVTTPCALPAQEDAAAPPPAALRSAYACALDSMTRAYGASGDTRAGRYAAWTNYATTPYVSATHAGRLSNNYANELAGDYARYEDLAPLPVGAVIAKDSITIAPNGQVSFGPLFLMEKTARSEPPRITDWRFTMIMPSGWVFGDTGGIGSDNVAFCADCHGAVAASQDSLYFLPAKHRR